jgi:hypothetical protein
VRHFSRPDVDAAKIPPSVIGMRMLPAANAQYYRDLHDRCATEERMLDADRWDEEVRILGDTDSPSSERSFPAKMQREFEQASRRTLGDIQIPPLPTYADEVEDDNYHADEDEPTGVRHSENVAAAGKPTGVQHSANDVACGKPIQHSANAADGGKQHSRDDVWGILDERDRRSEQRQACNAEAPPPPVRKTFAEAVERPPDHKSGIEAPCGVPHSTDGPPAVAMTAARSVIPARVESQKASANGAGAPSATLPMIHFGKTNAIQTHDVSAESRVEAVTATMEMMIVVDEIGMIRIKGSAMSAGAAMDHPVVAAVAVGHQETTGEATEFQTLMMIDSPYVCPDLNLVTLTHLGLIVVAARQRPH